VTDSFRHLHNLGRNIQLLWDRLPEELRALPEARFLHDAGHVARMDIVQLVYRPLEDQGTGRGYEFGRPTLRARWQAGAEDATATLAASPWLAPPGRQTGVRSFDVGFARGRHG
jgi:NTE family protein